jgi:hypothetical protein
MPKFEVRGRLANAFALTACGERVAARKSARTAARLAESADFAALAWRAWGAAVAAGGTADDKRQRDAAVDKLATGLDEALRIDFLRGALASG